MTAPVPPPSAPTDTAQTAPATRTRLAAGQALGDRDPTVASGIRGGVRAGVLSGALFVLLGALAINSTLFGVFVDDAVYLESGRQLVHTGEYRVPFLPGEPFAGKYPPLYPLVIGLSSLLFSAPLQGLWGVKFASLLMWWPGFVCLGGLWASRTTRTTSTGWVALWLSAVGGPALAVAVEVMSEGLFFSLSAACLWCLTGARQAERGGPTPERLAPPVRQIGAAVLAVLAWYTRGVGLALCLTVALCLARTNLWRGVVGGFGMAALCLPWLHLRQVGLADEPLLEVTPYLLSYDYHLSGLDTFLSEGGSALAYVITSLQAAARGLGGALLPLPLHPIAQALETPPEAALTGALMQALAWLLLAGVTLGAVRTAARGDSLGIFALSYAGIVVLWPWFNKVRFFAALLPLWFYLLADCLVWLSRSLWLHRKPGRTPWSPLVFAAWVTVVLAGASQLAHYTHHVFMAGDVAARIADDGTPRGPGAVQQASTWLKTHTEPSAVLVANFAGPLLAMHAERKVLPYLMAQQRGADHIASNMTTGLGRATKDSRRTLEEILQRAQPVLNDRPLWHVQLCRTDCEALARQPLARAFSGGGATDGPGSPTIVVTPLRR